MKRFEGKVVLITGGASGLGLAAARRFADEGAHIAIADLNIDGATAAAPTLGPRATAYRVDVGAETSVQEMLDAVVKHYGHIDVTICSAGLSDSFVPTTEKAVSHWQRLIDVNLTGTWLVARASASAMIPRKSGVILTFNSIAGVVGLPIRSAYSASKAGVAMLTRVLACEWAPHDIRVNAVAPGYIQTPMVERLIADGNLDPTQIVRRTPMGRFGTADQVADALLFLASDQATFITGVTLPVDGGYLAYGAPADAFDPTDLK
ncbi:MAG: glucose 1-dehydrogenase [Rhodospirillaceae bacterium]|nr:MAG: glucose 1-dehydrogenase [Rhodospirillaceae bacterium]